MAKNYTRFKISLSGYYQIDEQFTIHPYRILNIWNGQIKDTNLVYVNSGYTQKYIYFRLNILLQVDPKVIFKPISLRQIKDPNLIEQIKTTREYILLKYG